MKKILFLLSITTMSLLYAFKLDRVILATNNNQNYIQFWPWSARAWKEIVGVRPTLALIAHEDVHIDETLGDVIRFEPIEEVPTAFYAQCIRILLPCLFPDDFCIISDIDLIPLQKHFFTHYIRTIKDNCFVVYRNKHYRWWWLKKRYYMNYNAAKGSTFREIFGILSKEDIPHIIKKWHNYGIGWSTDEKMLYKYVTHWAKRNKKRLKTLGFSRENDRRIYKEHECKYNRILLEQGKYIEFNCPRPYQMHKAQIDKIMQIALLVTQKIN